MHGRSQRLLVAVAAIALASAGLVATAVPALAVTGHINSGGPLSITTTPDLKCGADYAGDGGQWSDDTACGTFVATGGTLYGPADIPSGSAASPLTAWTPVSQSAVTGAGTIDDPYSMTSVVQAAASGLRVVQTDRYVSGQESYRTDMVVTNTSAAAATGVIYRAADCELQDAGDDYGLVDPATDAVACTAGVTPGSRAEQFLPLTAGSRHLEDGYNSVWAAVGTQSPFDDTCLCQAPVDNGMGLSWSLNLPAGQSQTFSSLATFSPSGKLPLTASGTADSATVVRGAGVGLTISVTNRGSADVMVTNLSAQLPVGFSYQAGSTTGSTTTDPVISGSTLTWSGLTAPAGGAASVHIGVKASDLLGTVTTSVSGAATGSVIAPAEQAASLTVVPRPDQAPLSSDQTVSTLVGHAVDVTLAGSDPDGDPVSYDVVSNPSHGTISGTAPLLTYTPGSGYAGPDSFTFTTNDGKLTSGTANVTVNVSLPKNHAPVADAQAVTVPAGQASGITLTGSDPDGDSLGFVVADPPAHGSLSGTASALTYTPDAGYSGPDSFNFTVTDGTLTSPPASVAISVAPPVDQPPSATDASLTVQSGQSVPVTLAGIDPDGDALTYAVATAPAHGVLSGTAPNLTYTPADGYAGPDSFTFTASDGTLTSQPATVAVTVTSPPDRAPVAASDSISTQSATPAAVTLSATDADGDALTYAVSSGPTHGSLSGTAPNLTYTPAAGFAGADSFTFTASDATLTSSAATVSITVTPPPDRAPSAAPQSVSTQAGHAVPVVLSGSDPDGDPIGFTVLTAPSHGTLSGTGANRTYTPSADYVGADAFTFRVEDGTLSSDPATVTITVTAAPKPAPATVDTVVAADLHVPCDVIHSPRFSTSAGDELLVAYVSADGDGHQNQQVTRLDGGGLDWTLASRTSHLSGATEVWQAHATQRLSGAVVTAYLRTEALRASITVAAYLGAADQLGATVKASGTSGAPALTMTTNFDNSLVWGVGRDILRSAQTPSVPADQEVIHSYLDRRNRQAFWVQRRLAPVADAGSVDLSTSEPINGSWQFIAVEIPPAPLG
ncbi:MAG: hypothetical protein JWN95_856 [Frankiales bacterium]|nr:hypothetical protein [Frankiales bacterium]